MSKRNSLERRRLVCLCGTIGALEALPSAQDKLIED